MQIRSRFIPSVAAWLALSAPAAAAPDEPARETRPAFDAGDVRWRTSFRRVGGPEYVLAPALLMAGLAAQGLPEPPEAGWRGPILLDRSMQRWLRADSESGRRQADTVSDVLAAVSITQLLFDAWAVAAGFHGRPDVAWQMTVIDAQTYGLSELAVTMTKLLVARERPFAEQCDTACAGGPGRDCVVFQDLRTGGCC